MIRRYATQGVSPSDTDFQGVQEFAGFKYVIISEDRQHPDIRKLVEESHKNHADLLAATTVLAGCIIGGVTSSLGFLVTPAMMFAALSLTNKIISESNLGAALREIDQPFDRKDCSRLLDSCQFAIISGKDIVMFTQCPEGFRKNALITFLNFTSSNFDIPEQDSGLNMPVTKTGAGITSAPVPQFS